MPQQCVLAYPRTKWTKDFYIGVAFDSMFIFRQSAALVKDSLHCLEKHFNIMQETDESDIFNILCILNLELFIEIINDVKWQKDITELYSVEFSRSSGLLKGYD